MKQKITIIILALLSLSSCSFIEVAGSITREEEDTYIITQKDTSEINNYKNSPENVPRGIVYPSTKVTLKENDIVQKDSIVKRYYPDFIRLGLFESVGLIGTGNKNNSLNAGIFGVHYPINLSESFEGNESSGIFNGGLYRFGIFEKRLRWFKDAPNWTWGMHAFEMIMPDARLTNSLVGVAPLYLRKRWFVSDQIPYQTITAHIGINWLGAALPSIGGSAYLNLAASYDIGSIGGFNIRAYLGYAIGTNSQNTLLTINGNGLASADFDPNTGQLITPAVTSTTPSIFYAGVGMSLLDFHNRVPETYQEWEDMEHSSWNLGLARIGFLNAFTDYGITTADNEIRSEEQGTQLFTGFQLSLVNTEVNLPFFDKRFFVGTSLLNVMLAGRDNLSFIGGIGILPIRVGYWREFWQSASVSPFIEYNYYPSNIWNIGARINLVFPPLRNHHLSLVMGYLNGNPYGNIGNDILSDLEGGIISDLTTVSNFYVGISVGLYDKIFYEEDLRYFKE